MNKHPEHNPAAWKKVAKYLHIVLTATLIGLLLWGHFIYIPTNTRELLTETYPLLSPGRVAMSKDNLIVNIQGLRDKFSSYAQHDRFKVSAYFEYLPTGANININKDLEIFPASLLKLPVAIAVMKKIQDKEWNLDDQLVLLEQDRDWGWGTLYQLPVGTKFSVEDLLKKSILESDNSAHRILLRNISESEILRVYEHLGYEYLIQDNDSRISAKNYSIILRSLYNATYLEPNSSEMLLKMLSESNFHNFIGKGLPQDVVFAHKFGVDVNKGVYSDSGIVYVKDREYILTILLEKLTPDVTEEEVESLMGQISSEAYAYVSQY